MGMESALLGSLLTAVSGLCGVILSKLKCIYRRNEDTGECSPICAFSEKPMTPSHDEIIVTHEELGGELPVIIITKR